MRVAMIRSSKPSMRGASRLAALSILLLAVAIIGIWPAIVNGQPFVLSDTTSYIRGADAAVFHTTGAHSDWTDAYFERFAGRSDLAEEPSVARAANPRETEAPLILAGRSIYYGFILYLTDRLAGLHMAALLQALLAAVCVYATLARFEQSKSRIVVEFVITMAVLLVASPLAYFTSYLVPDIFSGLGILAAAHLLIRKPVLSRGWNIFWFLLLCVSGLVHSANILILAVVLVVLLAACFRLGWPSFGGFALASAAMLVSLVGEVAFYTSVDAATGSPPVRPPFAMARLIADGPGRDYLEDYCPSAGFKVCRHMKSLSDYSDSFLWSEDPADGVFSAVGYSERRAIASEENAFVLAVALDRPLAVVKSSLISIGRQTLKWKLPEFNYSEQDRRFLSSKLPSRVLQEQSETLAFQQRMPVSLIETAAAPVGLISLVLILWSFRRWKTHSAQSRFLLVLLIGVLADLIVCGALSTPHDRYLMRVAWLLPLGACILLWNRRLSGADPHLDRKI